MSKHQTFRALNPDEERSLRESIDRRGVVVPVVVDADGEVIDGHHRLRIGTELGQVVPQHRLDVRGDEARKIAAELNVARRHLSAEERAEYVVRRHTEGASLRTIAKEAGVGVGTVHRDLAASPVPDGTPDEVVGLDGKTYPARRVVRPAENEARTAGDPLPDPPSAKEVIRLLTEATDAINVFATALVRGEMEMRPAEFDKISRALHALRKDVISVYAELHRQVRRYGVRGGDDR